MKLALVVLSNLIAQHAVAAPLSISEGADAPLDDASDVARLTLRDEVMITHHGATGAFSIDPTIVEASARDGRVILIARGVGTTTVSIVTPREIVTMPVTVVAPRSWLVAKHADAPSTSWTQWLGQFESSTSRLTNSLELVDGNDRRTWRAYAVNVVRLDEGTPADLDARTSMPAMSLEWRTPRREVVLLDKLVEHSQLTLDGVTVRGAHLRLGGFQAHAGITSPVLYQNVFLGKQGELVFGASYELRRGRSSLTPSVYAYPSAPQTGGSDGAMGSLLYRYTSRDERLQLGAEAGWGGALGGAADLSYKDPRQRAWIKARYQPRGFATLGVGRPLGSTLDAVWTGQPSPAMSLTASTSAARYQTATTEQDVITASVEARPRLARRLTASLGMTSGQFDSPMTEMITSLGVPVGLHLESARAGASLTYRYQRNSARDEGGHGARLSTRVRAGAAHASAFLDVQQEAATVELILREEPVLAQLLNEMGLTASTPDDLARLLRENATLAQLGATSGATLDFNPWRAQAGGELAWIESSTAARQQLRLRVLLDRTQTVTELRDTRTASLSYSRHLGRNVELSAMATGWSRGGMAESIAWSAAGALRIRFDSVPRLRRSSRRDITGVVVDADGRPWPRVSVRLDGGRAVTTDVAGRFTFPSVAGGAHHVEAELPDSAYFLSDSRVTTAGGERVRFVLAHAPARIFGSILDDTGAGIAGLAFELRGGSTTQRATTDASGRFALAVVPGDYQLVPMLETVPVGFDASALVAESISARGGAPQKHDLVLPAQRSVAGTIHGGPASVRIVELGRTGTVDDEGRYVFRALPPGTFTVEATIGGKRRSRKVTLPVGPASIRDVDLR